MAVNKIPPRAMMEPSRVITSNISAVIPAIAFRIKAISFSLAPNSFDLRTLLERKSLEFLSTQLRCFSRPESRRFYYRTRNHRRGRSSRIETNDATARAAPANVVKKHVSAQRDQSHREQLTDRKLDTEQRVKQKKRADYNKGYAPGERVSI